jgi:hypothetical protein
MPFTRRVQVASVDFAGGRFAAIDTGQGEALIETRHADRLRLPDLGPEPMQRSGTDQRSVLDKS